MKAVRGRSLAALAVALSVLGCGGIPKTAPTQIVDLATNGFGSFLLLVYDESGLVVNAASGEREEAVSNPQAIAHPERNEVTVSWYGGACAHSPRLAVKGNAAVLIVELDPAPLEFSLVTQDCPLIGLFFAVTLNLAQPVEQNALTLTMLSQ